MEKFYVLDSDDPLQYNQWISIWQNWGSCEVFAHPEYVRIFTRKCDSALCAVQESIAGLIMLPMILRPIAAEVWADENYYYDVVAPYGYGGPYVSGSYDMEKFWLEFTRWAAQKKVISSFFRLSPFAADIRGFVDIVEPCGGVVIRSLVEGKEEIWRNFKHSVRTCVRCAEQAGLTVEFDAHGERSDDFIRIYYQTMKRLNASQWYFFPHHFFDNIVLKLAGQFVFGHVMYQGDIIASKLILLSQERIYPFLGGSDNKFMDFNPNQILDTQIFYWGIDHGKKSCVLGGGYDGQEDGVFQYKKKFAPSGVIPYIIGKHIFDKSTYFNLCKKRRQYEVNNGNAWNSETVFFPAYRTKDD